MNTKNFILVLILSLFVASHEPLASDLSTPNKPDQTPVSGGATRVTEPIAERVRRAGELALNGETARAAETIREAIRECSSNPPDSRDCSNWLNSLRGMNDIFGDPRKKTVYTNSVGMELVRLPPTDYMMGSLKQEMDWLRLTFRKIWRDGHKQWFQDEMPLHPVRITRPIYMGATEVTVGQFRQFVADTKYKTDAEKGDGGMIFSKKEDRWTPTKGMKWDSVPWKIADDQPVMFVSWNDAQAFCKWLSRKEKRVYRLPTEAEWEMGCRGGAAWVRYPWGNQLPGETDDNFGDGNARLPESMTTINDGYEYASPVKSYPPNGLGLYDMGGNAMEWVQDYYDRNYYDSSPVEDPQGPSVGTSRVNKGGNWFASPADCRCAFRGFSGDTMSFWNLGFRVVLEVSDTEVDVKTVKSGSYQDSRREAQRETDSRFPPSDEDGVRLFRQAMFAAQQQQWDNAIEDLEKALKIYEQREDPKWTARVKATLAGIYAERNRTYKSKELYTQALAEFRSNGDTSSASVILARLQELETSPGVKVVEVQKGSIADRAGIIAGDVIVEYGGETGFRVAAFKKLVDDFQGMEKITLSVMNDQNITTITIPGGALGVALEDIKRPPRPRRPPPQDQQNRQNTRQRRDRR